MRHPADPLDKNNPDHQHETQAPSESPSLRDAELWARRALGADRAMGHEDRAAHRQPPAQNGPGDGRHAPMRRRFARDGDVTVVLAQPGSGVGSAHRPAANAAPPVNRLANAEAALAAEQAARQRADRALAEAHSAIKRLQTQLAHAEMTGREALDGARQAEADRIAMAATLEAERAARLAAEQALIEAPERSPAPAGRTRGAARTLFDSGEAIQVKRPRGRPRREGGSVAAKREPKPVKWW